MEVIHLGRKLLGRIFPIHKFCLWVNNGGMVRNPVLIGFGNSHTQEDENESRGFHKGYHPYRRKRLMKTFRSICWACIIVILPFLTTCCSDSPIENYAPQSPDEQEIVALLAQYQDAKNRFDIERLLPLLHEEGEFSFQCGMMVSKARLEEILPGFWAELKSGNSAVIPLVHECINGDYYHTGRLNNPRIAIHGDAARATVLFTKGVCRVLLYVRMRHENDGWLITRTEWGES